MSDSSFRLNLRRIISLPLLGLAMSLLACAQPTENKDAPLPPETPPETPPATPAPEAPTGTPADTPTTTPEPPPAVVIPTPTPVPSEPVYTLGGPAYPLPLKLPALPTVAKLTNARDAAEIAQIQEKQKKFPTYAAWRRIADIYLKNGVFNEAARAFRAEAAMYRAVAKGTKDPKKIDAFINAALVQEQQAARYESSLQLFLERQATEQDAKSLYTGATLEPIIGCYLGAFIDRDDELKDKYFDENWQVHATPEEFQEKTGVRHASNFMYVSYGQKFPKTWIERCKKANVIPHIAWEPHNIKAVQNDAYLQGWAKAIRAADWPIFIRFAGEMNGFWTPYHKDPVLYRNKFKLVHQVLKKAAPRVATIWCVNSVPVDNIQNYYPGDDGCDWVGINLYSVPFYDNNPKRPALLDSPVSLIEPIYKIYAKRKPIAVCEYAASHMAAADKVQRVSFAIDKMSQLYTALPRLYPRIKLINWFSMNTMRHAKPGRQLNNYQLTEKKELVEHYRQIAVSPYFLGEPERLADPRPPVPFPLLENQKISIGASPNVTARLSVWVKTYVPRPKVYFQINGKIVYASNRPGAHTIPLNLYSLQPGVQTASVLVYDDKNRFITKLERKFMLTT